ncbi:MAG: hypothetical protein ACJ74O_20645 [Frankiaceae bacterium]
MTVTTEAKKVGDAIVASGRATLAEARKPALAWIGANAAVVARTRELPGIVQGQARQLAELAQGLPKLAAGLTGSVGEVAARVRGTYAELVGRGERTVPMAGRQPATHEAARQVADKATS